MIDIPALKALLDKSTLCKDPWIKINLKWVSTSQQGLGYNLTNKDRALVIALRNNAPELLRLAEIGQAANQIGNIKSEEEKVK